MGSGIRIRIWWFPVQTPLGACLGLRTEPCYDAPGDLQVEIVRKQWLTLGLWDCPFKNGPKLAMGQPNSSLKKWTINNEQISKYIFTYTYGLSKEALFNGKLP